MPFGLLILLGFVGAWAGYQVARQSKVNAATVDPLGLGLEEGVETISDVYPANESEPE